MSHCRFSLGLERDLRVVYGPSLWIVAGLLLGGALFLAACDSGGSGPPEDGGDDPALETLTVELTAPDTSSAGETVTLEGEVAERYSDDSQEPVDATALIMEGDTLARKSSATRIAFDTAFAASGERTVTLHARGESNAGSEVLTSTEETSVIVEESGGQPTLDRVTAEADAPASPEAEEQFTMTASGEEISTDGSTAIPDSLIATLNGARIRAVPEQGSIDIDTSLAEGDYELKAEVFGEGPEGKTDRATDTESFTVGEGRMLTSVETTADAPAEVTEDKTITLDGTAVEQYNQAPLEENVDEIIARINGTTVRTLQNTDNVSIDTTLTTGNSSSTYNWTVVGVGTHDNTTIRDSTTATVTVNPEVTIDQLVHTITGTTPSDPVAGDDITTGGETTVERSDGTTVTADTLIYTLHTDGNTIDSTLTTPTAQTWSFTSTTDDAGEYTSQVKAIANTNDDRATKTTSTTITVDQPVTIDNVITTIQDIPQTNEGGQATIDGETTVEFSDGTTGDADNLDWYVKQDGTTVDQGSFDPAGQDWTATTTGLAWGDYTAIAEGSATKNNTVSDSDTLAFHVNDVPEAILEQEGDLEEGSNTTFELTATDQDDDTNTGTLELTGVVNRSKSGETPLQIQVTPDQGGTITASYTVADDQSESEEQQDTFNVKNLYNLTVKLFNVTQDGKPQVTSTTEYILDGETITEQDGTLEAKVAEGTHTLNTNHTDFYDTWTSYTKQGSGPFEYLGKTDLDEETASINVDNDMTVEAYMINKTDIDTLTFPDGSDATFSTFKRQMDDRVPDGTDIYKPDSNEQIIGWWDTASSDTTLSDEQKDYLQQLLTGTGNPSIAYLTDGKLTPTFQDGGNEPDKPYIQGFTDTDMAALGTHAEAIIDGTNEIEFSQITLNSSKFAFDNGITMTEYTQTLGARRDPNFGDSEGVFVQKIPHRSNPKYSVYAETLFDILYNFPAGTDFK